MVTLTKPSISIAACSINRLFLYDSRICSRLNLHDEVRPHDGHGGDARARLGRPVGRAERGEHDRRRRAHHAEEGRVQRVVRGGRHHDVLDSV